MHWVAHKYLTLFLSAVALISPINCMPTPIQAIIPSLRFECPSFIIGCNIRAAGAKSFQINVQIWKPQDSTGTLYNLVWRREFRSRSTRLSSVNTFVNSSFSMSPDVPVRSGDVIGFYSLEPARFLFTSSPRDDIIYTEASQGSLCNFSLNDTSIPSSGHQLFPLFHWHYYCKQYYQIQLSIANFTWIQMEICVQNATN